MRKSRFYRNSSRIVSFVGQKAGPEAGKWLRIPIPLKPMKNDSPILHPKYLFEALASILIAVILGSTNVFAADTADLTVIDPVTNLWRMHASDDTGSYAAVQWGLEGDVRVPADYDGDGTKDIAVWRPSNGTWYIIRSRDGYISHIQWGLTTQYPTGGIEDVPVPADYDGDGTDDIAVWRPVDGRWYVLTSKSGFYPPKALICEWGLYGDVPVPADYDGDGRNDAAVFRSTQNRWYIAQSKTGNLDIRYFGIAGDDLLVPADYTGDGLADLAVFRSGVWYVQDITGHETEQVEFGFPDSQPVPADYDGDGTTDYAVYRDGTWFIYDSGTPRFRTLSFGREGEFPLNELSVKQSLVAVR